MKFSNSKKYIQEAIRIGDELISLAVKDKFGLSWKTMSFQSDNSIKWEKSPYIYDGVSGIALFFIELYQKTGLKQYLDTAVGALSWTENYCLENPDNNFAFYSGKTGISYCFQKMFEVTQEKIYIEKSLKILKGIDSYLQTNPICEFINGASGSLLGLLHIYNLTRDTNILSEINKHIEYVISKIQHGQVGFYWDRSSQNIRGLCGLSHGASGVGFVFLELAKYFNNKAFYWIADQAFAYEDNYFNDKQDNWPDFRKGIYSSENLQEHIMAYRNQNWQFFSQETYMYAWCHGAPGIGLSRLRTYRILNNKKYLNLTLKFLNNYIPNEDDHSFTLCHGLGGIAETYLQAYSLLKNPNYLSFAQEIADKIILSKKKGHKYLSGYAQYGGAREDYSLLNGNAGIGLFLLKMADIKFSSILIPFIEDKNRKVALDKKVKLNFSLADTKKKVIKYSFPNTFQLVEDFYSEHLNKFLDNSKIHKKTIITYFISFIKNKIKNKKLSRIVNFEKIFLFEKKKMEMKNNVKNDALFYMENYMQKEKIKKIEKLSYSDFLNVALQFNTNHSLYVRDWRITNTSYNNNKMAVSNINPPTYLLLKFNYQNIEEVEISAFCFIIFSILMQILTVKEVIETFTKNYVKKNSTKTDEINKMIISQIKEGLHSEIVFLVDT